MNAVLYYVFFAGIVYLPLAVLVIRAKWPQWMPWLLAFPVVAVVGWACLIGLAFSDDISTGEAAASGGFVAVFFGWAYSLLWFMLWVIGYGIVQYLRRLLRANHSPTHRASTEQPESVGIQARDDEAPTPPTPPTGS
jgi:hypothetical protein